METIVFSDSKGNPLEGILSMPKSAYSVVLLSHGFSSNKSSVFYRELQDELNKDSIGTFRYDYYGHGPVYGHYGKGYGLSPDVTLTKTVESLKAAIKCIRDRGDYDVGLLGSSFGGLVSLVTASHDKSIKALALKSPVTEPVSFWRERLGDEKIKKWKEKGIMHYEEGLENYDLEYGLWEDALTYDTLDMAKNIACPVLIVHGGNDTCVPIKQSYNLAKIVNTKVRVVNGADHGYNSPAHYIEMKRLMIDFLKENLPH